MPAKMEFRGVMLFQCSKAAQGSLEHVLLPDGDGNPDWGKDAKHPDKSEAIRHYAGLVFEPKGKKEVMHVPLKGAKVTIKVGQATTAASVALEGLPRLRPATFKKGSPDKNKGATTIQVYGGTLKAAFDLPADVESATFATEALRFHGAELDGGAADPIGITIEFSGGETITLSLGDGDDAAIYNYEVRYPAMKDLKQVGVCVEGRTQDDDFKWLYSLLDGWDKGNDLLAPRVRCPNSRFITVFTCFPAVWENDVA